MMCRYRRAIAQPALRLAEQQIFAAMAIAENQSSNPSCRAASLAMPGQQALGNLNATRTAQWQRRTPAELADEILIG